MNSLYHLQEMTTRELRKVAIAPPLINIEGGKCQFLKNYFSDRSGDFSFIP